PFGLRDFGGPVIEGLESPSVPFLGVLERRAMLSPPIRSDLLGDGARLEASFRRNCVRLWRRLHLKLNRWRLVSRPSIEEAVVLVGNDQLAVAVSADEELPLVVQGMVPFAEAGAVGAHGGASVGAMDDVVVLRCHLAAARDPAQVAIAAQNLLVVFGSVG